MNSDPVFPHAGSIAPPLLIVRRPEPPLAPLVVSSPHSGRDYPAEFVASSRLQGVALRKSEDSFVDELFGSAPSYGAALLAASFPRAFCDVNREAWELDPAMFEDELPSWVNTTSPRVRAGLGTIARITSNGSPIYGHRLRFAEAERRIRSCWQPYHDTLSGLIDKARGRFGASVLIDCHSMPAHACEGRKPTPDIVLGDAHGTSCAPALMREMERMLRGLGYTVRRNDPYAGGYVTRHYGRPDGGIHAVQIELARCLYMDEASMEKAPGFDRVQADMSALVEALVQQALDLTSARNAGT